MIVEGQIMGGLTEAYAMANMQFITFDDDGNCIGGNYMDYLLPTAWGDPWVSSYTRSSRRVRTTRSVRRGSVSVPRWVVRQRS